MTHLASDIRPVELWHYVKICVRIAKSNENADLQAVLLETHIQWCQINKQEGHTDKEAFHFFLKLCQSRATNRPIYPYLDNLLPKHKKLEICWSFFIFFWHTLDHSQTITSIFLCRKCSSKMQRHSLTGPCWTGVTTSPTSSTWRGRSGREHAAPWPQPSLLPSWRRCQESWAAQSRQCWSCWNKRLMMEASLIVTRSSRDSHSILLVRHISYRMSEHLTILYQIWKGSVGDHPLWIRNGVNGSTFSSGNMSMAPDFHPPMS